jgi:hypothetical protein
MSVHILHDEIANSAVLYCSTSLWAFGPVFSADETHDALDRAHEFLVWIDTLAPYWSYEKTQIGQRRDVRCLTEEGMQRAYSDWLAAEPEYWTSKETAAAAEE